MGGSIPVSRLQDLFPPGQMIIEEDDGPMPRGGSRDGPRGEIPPDAIIQDMMREMDQAFQDDVLPQARNVAGAPDSCARELKAHCRGAPSQLHCLGKYASDISDKCRADVGKSVPFLCSDAIDRYCDVMTGGILTCLTGRLDRLE